MNPNYCPFKVIPLESYIFIFKMHKTLEVFFWNCLHNWFVRTTLKKQKLRILVTYFFRKKILQLIIFNTPNFVVNVFSCLKIHQQIKEYMVKKILASKTIPKPVQKMLCTKAAIMEQVF